MCTKFLDESEIRSPASADSSTSCASSNNATSTNELATNLPDWMTEGERILLRKSNLSGTIAYIGAIEFASGIWIGIELDAPVGKKLLNELRLIRFEKYHRYVKLNI